MSVLNPVIVGIKHRCGAPVPLGQLPELKDDEQSLSYLQNLGLKHYRSFEDADLAVLRPCIVETLDEAGVAAAAVDAFIFYSTTFDPYKQHSDLALMASELGITNALPYGVFHNQCTNYSQALQLAQLLVASGEAREVLVAGWDVLDEARGKRVMDNRVSVYSDVALSCLVRAEAPTGFRIDGIAHHYAPRIASLEFPRDLVKYIQEYSGGFKSVCASLRQRVKVEAKDFKRLITANYNKSVLRNLAELAEMPVESLFLNALEDYAHCFAADQLIALELLERRQEVVAGDRLMLVAVGGFVVFSAIGVTRLHS